MLLAINYRALLPSSVKFGFTQPTERSHTRARKALACRVDPADSQYLRRAAISLQVLVHAHSNGGQVHGQVESLLLCMARSSAGKVISSDFVGLVGLLHLDTDLAVSVALALLFGLAT